jgi:hypothetical protein
MPQEIDVGGLANEIVQEIHGGDPSVLIAELSRLKVDLSYNCTGQAFTCQNENGYTCKTGAHECVGVFTCAGGFFTYPGSRV